MSLFFTSAPRRDAMRTTTAQDLIPSRVAGQTFDVPVTTATAPQVVAFGAAVNLLASVVSMLPVKAFTGSGATQREAPAPALLADPGGRGYGLGDWLIELVTQAATTGNAVGVVTARDGLLLPTVVELQPWPAVSCFRDRDGRHVWRVTGREIKDPRDVFHLRRHPVPGETMGMSPVAQFATTLGVALSTERFGAQWFGDGAHPSAVLETDQAITQDVAEKLKTRFMARSRGSREPVVLGAGTKFRPIQVSPEESQFLATQQFTAAQVCRIIGPGVAEILGYPTGGSLTYSTREQAAIDLLTYTLDPWLVLIERALSGLIGGRRWVRFERGALLRTDLKSRFEAHRLSLGPMEPWATANEIRDLEDRPPVDWGQTKPPVQGAPPLSLQQGAPV